ncbi:ferredoxin-type protein NapH [Cytobacillus eiseniae]|uniref:Ferredoxin-type protein NapH n=1 Tax=Cytobacillus eiseniae TaxID=762947 RepID=A0ABS4RBR0_9BACI|nr:NapH/MauN family ferredoxin-type protein [Cytobacillus eiseniae]MBP2239774.1 ferredoxin-type protein NapH [Cytobacillus eiseniae]
MSKMKKMGSSLRKWTVARKIVQFSIIALFLSPLIFAVVEGDHFFFGSLGSSTFIGIVLSDPFAALQVILASKKINIGYLSGAMIIFLFYFIVSGRVFCSWVCPVNTLLELTEKLRKYIKVPDKIYNRHIKKQLALAVLVLSFIVGVPVFELVSPIGFTVKNALFTFGIGIWIILAIVLFELLISKRGWCRYFCPLGGFYQSFGEAGVFNVKFDHDACVGCDTCRSVCFADPVILEPGIYRESKFVVSGDCSLCGACVDHCPFNALKITAQLPTSRAKEDSELNRERQEKERFAKWYNIS